MKSIIVETYKFDRVSEYLRYVILGLHMQVKECYLF